jgi:hypothetical protein
MGDPIDAPQNVPLAGQALNSRRIDRRLAREKRRTKKPTLTQQVFEQSQRILAENRKLQAEKKQVLDAIQSVKAQQERWGPFIKPLPALSEDQITRNTVYVELGKALAVLLKAVQEESSHV